MTRGALQRLPEGAVARLAPLLKEARRKAEYQRLQCVWLRATLGLTSSQIAPALGWQASSVRHVQARSLRPGEAALRDQPRGHRRPLLTAAAEQALLGPFVAPARQGTVVTAAPVCQAYADQRGRPAPASLVYRALPRQGWRKGPPRPPHPPANTEAPAEFKKTTRPRSGSSDAPSRAAPPGPADV